MADLTEEDELYKRRDTLRLRGFDYTARRVYFVTIVAAGRRRIFLEQWLARAVVERLLELRGRLGFKLYCYCLMPDHFHALVGTGDSGRSLGEICGAFKSLTTRDYWRGHQGRLWQRQFYDHVVRNEEDFFETLEYIELNPVRKGLVGRPDQWPYTGKIDVL
jgi:putative transposase